MIKYQKNRAQEIQKEQLRLVKVENILTKILTQVNESINELKVEELHIKSSLIEYYTTNHNDEEPSTSAQAALRMKSANVSEVDPANIRKPENAIDMEGIENINKQILALESLIVPYKRKKFHEEEEEDDDEDDNYDPAEASESEEEVNEFDIKTRLKR